MNGLSVGNINKTGSLPRTCFFMPDGLSGQRKRIAGKVDLPVKKEIGDCKIAEEGEV